MIKMLLKKLKRIQSKMAANPDHPDVLSNLINYKSDINKSYLYGQDPYETKK